MIKKIESENKLIKGEKMLSYLKLMRIKHYIKNLLIFLPLIFADKLFDFHLLLNTIIGFISFSLIASIVYIINDIHDLEYDRNHDIKKNRPLASGKISVKNAIILSGILGTIVIILNIIVNNTPFAWTILLVYVLINLAYTYGLKNIPLVDISIIVTGFILRVTYGGTIIDVKITNWMYLTIIGLSFYLALGKRRNEIKKVGNSARAVLKYYTEQFLDKMMYVSLGISIVFYSLWCMAPSKTIHKSENLIWTVPLVLLICMRYSMNVEGDNYGDPAEILLNDKILIILVLIYGVFLMLLIYNTKIFNILGL